MPRPLRGLARTAGGGATSPNEVAPGWLKLIDFQTSFKNQLLIELELGF